MEKRSGARMHAKSAADDAPAYRPLIERLSTRLTIYIERQLNVSRAPDKREEYWLINNRMFEIRARPRVHSSLRALSTPQILMNISYDKTTQQNAWKSAQNTFNCKPKKRAKCCVLWISRYLSYTCVVDVVRRQRGYFEISTRGAWLIDKRARRLLTS